MSQSAESFCPNCGAPLAPGQRFCSSCGSTLAAGAGDPTAMAPGSSQGYTPASGVPIDDATQLPVAPPPPPPDSYSQPPNTFYPPQVPPQGMPLQQQVPPPVLPAQQSQQAVPQYAKPQKDSSRGVLGQIGCGVLAIILVVLLICGAAGYFIYHAVSSSISSANATATAGSYTTTSSNTTTGGNGSPQAIPMQTAQINQTVTYASVDTTIASVQEASRFSDDPNSNAAVMLRINIKEHNTSTNTAFLNYNSNYLLVLPDKSTVAASNSQASSGINQAVQRNNWLDFPLTKSIPINQLTLQIGATTEAQLSIPLTGNANLSAYQAKTITPNTTFQYEGLKWTLTKVASSLSYKAGQAKTGMRFITLSFTLENSSSNTIFTSANTYARLQQGSTTNSETDDTMPTALNSGTTGATGTITFEMPQSGSSFMLIMLAQPNSSPPVSQQTVNFQI